MVDDTSVADSPRRATLRFHRVVIIGGGCYGSWYARQMARAAVKGALACDEVLIVDRNAAPLARERQAQGEFDGLPVTFVEAEWSDFLAEWLGSPPEVLRDDALVPSPLMPHLLFDWLVARARSRWPGRPISVQPLDRHPTMPWQRSAPDGRHYVSFADWTCPINCIEPARCPATRGERDWSMPVAIGQFVRQPDPPAGSMRLHGPVIFHCVHRTWGVGMIDASPIVAADAEIAEWAKDGPANVLVGTMSHCHGALGVLAVG
jgi:hypothetical protein